MTTTVTASISSIRDAFSNMTSSLISSTTVMTSTTSSSSTSPSSSSLLLRKLANSNSLSAATPEYVDSVGGETVFEVYSDILLGIAFFIAAIVAAKRMSFSHRQQQQQQQQQQQSANNGRNASQSSSAETTVVTAFYSLILLTSLLRAIWFLIPAKFWQPSYTPIAMFAWETSSDVSGGGGSWVGAALSELTVTAGSLTLFSIFILILVYWADILKKYFHPGSRRSLPTVTFFGLVSALLALEVINLICFLCQLYSTEGMVLFNALLLAIVSIVCVCEISIFSHRFRTVLKTLGAINQVSTDSQVRRIVWITVTGNLFFCTRALLELVFAAVLLVHYKTYGTVAKVFTHVWWDTYTLIKYWSEVTILALMLYILQSRFTTDQQSSTSQQQQYTKVPDAEPGDV